MYFHDLINIFTVSFRMITKIYNIYLTYPFSANKNILSFKTDMFPKCEMVNILTVIKSYKISRYIFLPLHISRNISSFHSQTKK
jgi:hypothetical protein